MRRSISRCVLSAGAAGLFIAHAAKATPILAVDVQTYSSESPVTEAGFQAFDNKVSTGTTYGGGFQSYTYSVSGVSSGAITVGLAAVNGTLLVNDAWNDRDRGAGGGTDGTPPGYTYAELYRDFIFLQNGNYGTTGPVNGMDFVISGLNPNTQYAIDVYSDDTSTPGEVYSFRDVTSGGVPSSSGSSSTSGAQNSAAVYTTVTSGANPTSNEEYATGAHTFTSDGSGNIVINEESSSGYEEIDGLTISAVPEPTTLAAAGIALPLVLARRRRRR